MMHGAGEWLRLTVHARGTGTDVAVRTPVDDDSAVRAEIRDLIGLPAGTPLIGEIRDAGVLTDRPHPPEGAGIVLAVETGPDCGRVFPVPGRTITIGRAPGNDVTLADPAVSRHHVTARYDARGLGVSLLSLTNPIRVDDRPAHPPISLTVGQLLTIGRSGLRVLASREAAGPAREAAAAPGPASSLEVPAPPDPPRPRSLSVAAIVIPVIVAGVLVAVTHTWFYLTFCAFGPMTAIASFLSDKRSGKRRSRKARTDYRAARQRFETNLARTLARETAELRSTFPVLTAPRTQPGSGTPPSSWVRIGTADLPAAVTLTGRHDAEPTPVLRGASFGILLQAAGAATGEGTREAAGAAARESARESARPGNPVVIGGNPDDATALARSIAVQLCAARGAGALRLVLADPDDDAWSWTRWLPHRGPAAARAPATLYIDNSSGEPSATPAAPETITLIPRAVPGAPATLICCGDSEALAGPNLPGRRPLGRITLDLMSAATAEARARAAARAGNRGANDSRAPRPGIPSSIELSGLVPMSRRALAARWARREPTTSAIIGADAAGPLAIDLRRDGPHLMIAGTTGAGKSELLQTLIFSLAARNHPGDLQFVLFDFKGGSGLRWCAELPHTAGTVTDLDEHLAVRAFTSLQAELRRRERLFADAGVADFDEYRDRGSAAPARLVIVIDEFRVLAEEQPDLLATIVRTVCVGRSLGVHLLLATQRPAGIVSADMQANINSRISLRVRDAADSRNVIDAPDAAGLSAALPGRAFLRTGGGQLTEFQSARTVIRADTPADPPGAPDRTADGPAAGAAGGAAAGPPGSRVRLLTASDPLWHHLDRGGPGPHAEPGAGIDVGAFARAAGPAVTTPAPWLPPLPDTVRAPDLGPVPPLSVPLGLGDEPATVSQTTVVWSPAVDGNLLIAGTTRSGKSETVRVVLDALAGPAGAALYVLDGAGRHEWADSSGAVGARVTPAEAGRAVRVIERLKHETSIRSFGAAPRTPIVLIIDGWEAWQPVLEGHGSGEAIDDLTVISRSGPGAGVFLLAAGDRPLAMSKLGATISNKILLRQSDSADFLLLGATRAAIPSAMPPGRGLAFGSFGGRRADALEVQLATGTVDPDGAVDPDGGRSGHAARAGHARPPFVVRRLPAKVALADLAPPTPSGIPIGVGGDDGGTVTWAMRRHLLIAGPPGSGRTTALDVVAKQCRRIGLPVFRPQCVAPDPAATESVDPESVNPASIVLIDDLDSLAPALEQDVVDLVVSERLIVAAAGSTDRLASAFTGLAGMLKTGRHGVLLAPSRPMDGEVFAVRVAPPPSTVPGRGLFIDGSRQMPCVVAQPWLPKIGHGGH